MFEENPEQHEEIVLEGHRSFTQVTLQNHPEWQPFCVNLQEKFYEYIDRYMKDCDVTDMMFPQQFAFEQFRLKRYMPNDVDEFADHVDVGNYASVYVDSWYSFYTLMTTRTWTYHFPTVGYCSQTRNR